VRKRWMQVVLILPAGGSANSSISVVMKIIQKNFWKFLLCILFNTPSGGG
jgi:hypothetical protein